MTEQTSPVNIIRGYIDSRQDDLFHRLDKLHRRGIHDDAVVDALRELGETRLLESYAEWAGIDLRTPEERLPDTPVPDPGDAPSYEALRHAIAAGGGLNYTRSDVRGTDLTELEKQYRERFQTDPVFHHQAKVMGDFLDHLDSAHQLGDTDYAGFLLAALLDRNQRELLRNVWEQGMAAAKLSAAGIKAARNPYDN